MHARPLSAALLRRLGEAADGFRTGRPIYVVACYDDPREDLRVFECEADALEHLTRAGDRFGMFGPFATPADRSVSGGPLREVAVTPGTRSVRAGEVAEVAVTIRAESGEERTVRLDGREHDALFWTASAIDKFAVPYYAHVQGAEFAAELRRRVMAGPVCAIVHLPHSEPEEVDDPFQDYGAPWGRLQVTSVTLAIRQGGETREVRLDGREYDSVLWSLSAIDKFAVPYYARADGAEFAAELRRRVMAGPVCAIAHYPTSEPYEVDDPFEGYGAPGGGLQIASVAVPIL